MGVVKEITEPEARSALCSAILADLTDWFGRPDATEAYIEAIAGLTTFAWEVDGMQAGFAALSRPTNETFDVHVLGVLRQYHGRGGGRALLAAGEDHARAAGAVFLSVQTVGPSASDPFYEKTRAFYGSCGMAAMAEFPDYWGRGTPMLLMAKAI
ncbi:MAG: GNAT family N-acetyltransferase [Pseudomonadota bacterium]